MRLMFRSSITRQNASRITDKFELEATLEWRGIPSLIPKSLHVVSASLQDAWTRLGSVPQGGVRYSRNALALGLPSSSLWDGIPDLRDPG